MLQKFKLEDMIKGWFVGKITPTVYSTESCEVAIKKYNQGDYEPAHYHKIATELTVIIKGKVKMNGEEYIEGDIVKIEPGISTDFLSVTDTITAVVKIPGAINDKYIT